MKRRKAAALNYDDAYDIPTVTALGYGAVAENIIKKANETNVPVIENTELVESLMELDLDQQIPSELYETVAKVIAFVYSLNESRNRRGT